jgi:hypothetical protein
MLSNVLALSANRHAHACVGRKLQGSVRSQDLPVECRVLLLCARWAGEAQGSPLLHILAAAHQNPVLLVFQDITGLTLQSFANSL